MWVVSITLSIMNNNTKTGTQIYLGNPIFNYFEYMSRNKLLYDIVILFLIFWGNVCLLLYRGFLDIYECSWFIVFKFSCVIYFDGFLLQAIFTRKCNVLQSCSCLSILSIPLPLATDSSLDSPHIMLMSHISIVTVTIIILGLVSTFERKPVILAFLIQQGDNQFNLFSRKWHTFVFFHRQIILH
jgi:hypothetical protein